ncbi:MAG TPA: FAD:protein FMN transferase [Chitinophagaceae bacterium]|nr:FAD:protein FMN transferase [Chitinophagaceae bacterium]
MRTILLFFLSLNTLLAGAQEQRYTFSAIKMGSPFRVICYVKDTASGRALERGALGLVDSLNNIFSDYLPGSELNRLCSTAGMDSFVSVSDPLYDILVQSEEAWKQTKGRFDITIGPLSRSWRRWRREKYFPAPDSVHAARSRTGFKKLVIDKSRRQIKLLGKGMQLDLGGIGAGYIAEAVLSYLSANGVGSALVDASGDIVCGGAPPAKKGWVIGVNLPGKENRVHSETIILSRKSVSTSGDVFQYIEHDGKKYSHIIDPITGYGVTHQRNVTIIAKDGATADWLATACSIVPMRQARRLVRRAGGEFLIAQMVANQLKTYSSPGFKNYWNKETDIP